MTERERWVVYPLLFLALGAALRDKLVDRTITKSIVCQELAVVDEEPLGRQPPRVLAKIGRTESKTGGPAAAYLAINGQVEIIDDDPAGVQPPHTLIKIGRTEPSPGAPSSGEVIVDGVINAKQYAYQGVMLMPTWQSLPAVPIPKMLHPLQQPNQNRPTPNAPKAQAPSRRPATAPDNNRGPAPAPPRAGDQPPTK